MDTHFVNRPLSAKLLGVATGIILAAGIASPAHASISQSAETSGKSCWYDLESDQSVCVETGSGLIEAVREQTGIVLDVPDGTIIDGEVYEPVESSARSYDTSAPSSAALAATTVVGTLYDDINYGGGTLVLTAPGSCGRYSFDNLGGFGWNDRASSYRTYAGCRGTAYRDNNLGGSASSTTANAPSLGSLNDQASSFRVAP